MDKLSPTLDLNFRTAGRRETEGHQADTAYKSQAVTETRNSAPGALILGGAHGSLAIARSLGRRGINVSFATNDHPLAKYSRYVKRSLAWPGPNDPNAISWLLAFAACWGGLEGCVLFPGGDAELRLLSQYYDVLAKAFHVAVPAWSVTQFAHDKRLTQQHALAVGVATPRSIYPSGPDDVANWSGPFPVVIKPTVHDVQNAFTRAKAWRADNPKMLLSRYKEAAALMEPNSIVVQEMIPGGGEAQFSYAGVWRDGEPVAALVARRTRQFPLDFGYTSTFVETIDRPEIAAAAEKYLRALKFSGLVELEFKHDSRDGLDKLLDVNARAWAWLGIGEAADVDFPYLAFQIATGQTVKPQPAGRNAAWVHTARNFVARLQEMGRGKWRKPPRPTHLPTAYAAFAIDDPVPGLVELPLAIGRAVTRRMKAMFGGTE